MLALLGMGAWHLRVVCTRTGEYRRIIRATMYLFTLVTIIAYTSKTDLVRGYVAIALPWVSPRCARRALVGPVVAP